MESKALLVIGNGFDKSLGLNTGYKEFLESEEFNSAHITAMKSYTYSNLTSEINRNFQLNNWVDVEMAIRKYAIELENNGIEEHSSIELKSEFDNLKSALTNYLKRNVLDLSCSQKNAFFKYYSKLLGKDFSVMNFNYTNTFLKATDKMGLGSIPNDRVFNIHGTLENNNIIFGIDDTDNLSQKITFLQKSAHLNYGARRAVKLLSTCSEVFFYGISLGETDRHYFQDFFSNLIFDSEGKSLYFSFYGQDGLNQLNNSLRFFTENKLNKLKMRHDESFFDCEKHSWS